MYVIKLLVILFIHSQKKKSILLARNLKCMKYVRKYNNNKLVLFNRLQKKVNEKGMKKKDRNCKVLLSVASLKKFGYL